MAKYKEQLQQLIRRQQDILAAARAAGRELTAEENSTMEELQRNIEEMGDKGEEESDGDPASGDEVQRNITLERARVTEIVEMCRDFGMDSGEYIKNGTSVEEVRKVILKEMKDRHTPVRGSARGEFIRDEDFCRNMTDALLMRSGMVLDNPTEEVRNLSHASLRDMAIMCLSRSGENAVELMRMSSDAIYERMARQFYNPTAVFPAILEAAIQKSIVKIYEEVPTTFQLWTTVGSLKDFKVTDDHSYVIGGSGELLLVPENGELKADDISTEKLPTRKLDTYGRQFSMSRQAFINDDIGFLTEIPALYAAKAKRQINRQCYKLLFNNETIFDGKTLFHADHNNLMEAGSAPTVSSTKGMMVKMMMQKDQFGNPINVSPDKVIAPVGYGFELDVLFNSTHIPGSNNNDINPLRNKKLQIIEDAELNALAGENACPWFMGANPLTARGVQVDYLNGQTHPTIRRGEKPGTLGFVWDIYMDWGISVRDFRGLVKNPGVEL